MAGTNPRAVRVAGLIQRVVATALQRDLRDPRLAHVTITEVRVTNDLQIARIYWTYLGDDGHERGQRKRAKQALQQSAGRLRSMVGRKAGLRLTPQLQFIYDEVPAEATEVEDVLTVALKRDQELAKLRENATYAGDADPYRHDDERKGADSADSDDSEGADGAYGAGYGDYDDDGEYDDSDVDFPDDDEDIDDDDDDDTADDASAGDGDSAR